MQSFALSLTAGSPLMIGVFPVECRLLVMFPVAIVPVAILQKTSLFDESMYPKG